MYTPKPFRIDRTASLGFAAARGFGLICVCDGETPVAASLPFHLDYAADGTPRLAFHVSRENPLAAVLAGSGKTCLVAVNGVDAYVSPHWYASPEQVPTWLYRSVHLSGPAISMSACDLARHLASLSAHFEAALAPKPAWTATEMSPARHAAMLRAIVGFTVSVERVEGSFKLNQHKSDADHLAVAGALEKQDEPAARALGGLMRAMRPVNGEAAQAMAHAAGQKELAQ
jgi:transcriptional regulator